MRSQELLERRFFARRDLPLQIPANRKPAKSTPDGKVGAGEA
jgi:hypothetical protein